MNINEIPFEELPSKLYEYGMNYAKAKAKKEMLDDSKKSVLAKEASNHQGSEATKNRIALTSDVYKEYLHWYQQAIQEELELKYTLNAIEMRFEYCRSMNSRKKAEMRL